MQASDDLLRMDQHADELEQLDRAVSRCLHRATQITMHASSKSSFADIKFR